MKVNHGRTYHYHNNYRDLDHLLGAHWDKRMVNKAGDYAYIVPGQLFIYVSWKKDIVEYMYQGGIYVEVVNEQHSNLVFNFTRRVGNKRQYELSLKT